MQMRIASTAVGAPLAKCARFLVVCGVSYYVSKRLGFKNVLGGLLICIIALYRVRWSRRPRRDASGVDRSHVYIPFAGRVSRQHLQLMLRDEFTPEDYEALLALDDDVGSGDPKNSVASIHKLLPMKRLAEEVDRDCPICLDELCIGDYVRTLECQHLFHGPCLETWLKKSSECPVCKTVLL